MRPRLVTSDSVLASSVLPTPAGPSTSTGRPIRAARKTTVEMRRLAMYRASLNRCWTSSTDSNMRAPYGANLGVNTRSLYPTHPCVRPVADHPVAHLLGGRASPRARAIARRVLPIRCASVSRHRLRQVAHRASMPRRAAMYNARMSEPRDAARYHRLQLWLGLAGFALSAAYLLALLASGVSARLALIVSVLTDAWWTQVVAVALPVRTANAAVVGLGRTRRIILFDTLASAFGQDEVEAVLAHELGHHVHGDVRRGLLVQGALTLVTFWAAGALLRAGVPWWNLEGPADPAGLPWLALVMLLLGALQLPLANAFSRWIERQADDFALGLTRDPGAFIGAMERLGTLNLAERRPHRLKEILLYSHPALDRRIARARGDAA